MGFVGEHKYNSIILVGTKSDKADDDELVFFRERIVPAFFKHNGGKGSFALTKKVSPPLSSGARVVIPQRRTGA